MEYYYHYTSMKHEAERYLEKQKQLGFDGFIKRRRTDMFEIITWLKEVLKSK